MLGLHIEGTRFKQRDTLVNTGAPLKILNPPEQSIIPADSQMDVTGRMYTSQRFDQECLDAGMAGADRWWAEIGPLMKARPWVTRWEFKNEPVVAEAPDRAKVDLFNAQMLYRCEDGLGKPGLAFSFSVGNPPAITMHEFEKTLRVISDAQGRGVYHGIALHEYGSRTLLPQDPWDYPMVYRHRMIHAELVLLGLSIPMWVTEFGVDGGKGYKGWKLAWRDYLNGMRYWADQVWGDTYVRAAHVFCATPKDWLRWRNYTLGDAELNEIIPLLSATHLAFRPPFVANVPPGPTLEEILTEQERKVVNWGEARAHTATTLMREQCGEFLSVRFPGCALLAGMSDDDRKAVIAQTAGGSLWVAWTYKEHGPYLMQLPTRVGDMARNIQQDYAGKAWVPWRTRHVLPRGYADSKKEKEGTR